MDDSVNAPARTHPHPGAFQSSCREADLTGGFQPKYTDRTGPGKLPCPGAGGALEVQIRVALVSQHVVPAPRRLIVRSQSLPSTLKPGLASTSRSTPLRKERH